MVDGFLDRRSDIKNMHEISVAMNSLTTHADSVGRSMYSDIMSTTYRGAVLTPADSVKIKTENIAVINTDSIYNSMTSQEKLKVLTTTENRVKSLSTDWDMKSFLTKDTDNSIRSHRSDWHKKITLSLACIIFFFIGAPFRGYYPKRRAWNAGCYFCIDLCHLLYYRLWSNPCCKEWGNEYRFRYLDGTQS